MLKDILDQRIDLQKHLFVRGFLITNEDLIDIKGSYPFYSNWKLNQIGKYNFWVNNLQKLYVYVIGNIHFFLIGHAYNPFTMDENELNILKQLSELYFENTNKYQDKIDELTGLFITGIIKDDSISFQLDCSGMQYGCYGEVDSKIYIASHMQLVGDILDLNYDPFVTKLINYKWYKYMMGNYLPGDLTAFESFKRIIPNTNIIYENNGFKIERFYPNKPIKMVDNQVEYDKVIEEASEIMKNNMELISKKWTRPAISLTGGIDSNTTFASANGLYHKFETFSYISMYRESVDADAAKQISDRFNVKHKIYNIPDNNEDIQDFEIYKEILSHNDGDIGPTKDDDTRKKIFLMQNDVCEIEVKSWISETIRAYAYKYFGRTKMLKRLKARHFSSLYKLFFFKRGLLYKTDKHFKEYLDKTDFYNHMYNYDQSDFFVWEMMHGGKCGLNIGTMKFCFDITIPYNNRKLLDLLLRVNLTDRINDKHHNSLKMNMNSELAEMNIRVINLNETKKRKMMANLVYIINTIVPF